MAEADKVSIGERIAVCVTDALIVVDVQPTFMPGGGLPVPGGDEVVPVIKDLMGRFPKRRRIATKDRHPRGHISLASSYADRVPMSIVSYDEVPPMIRLQPLNAGRDTFRFRIGPSAKFTAADLVAYLEHVRQQALWPDHAIAGTAEAELHEGLNLLGAYSDAPEAMFGYVLVKGTDPREDSYSGFKGNAGTPTELADVLRDLGVTRIFVCGLALDYCVRFTAEDGKAAGFEVIVISDATRAVFPDKIGVVYASLREKGIRTMSSEDILAPARQ